MAEKASAQRAVICHGISLATVSRQRTKSRMYPESFVLSLVEYVLKFSAVISVLTDSFPDFLHTASVQRKSIAPATIVKGSISTRKSSSFISDTPKRYRF